MMLDLLITSPIVFLFVCGNIAAYVLYFIDKNQHRTGGKLVPLYAFFIVALLGGGVISFGLLKSLEYRKLRYVEGFTLATITVVVLAIEVYLDFIIGLKTM